MKLLNGKSRFKCVQLPCTFKQCGFTKTSREGSQWLELSRAGPGPGPGPGPGVDLEMENDNCGHVDKAGKLPEGRICAVFHFALPHSLHSSCM